MNSRKEEIVCWAVNMAFNGISSMTQDGLVMVLEGATS